LETDIEKCFERICHEELLTKIHTSPILRRQLKAWLKVLVAQKATILCHERCAPHGG